jgi:hypothetical protein
MYYRNARVVLLSFPISSIEQIYGKIPFEVLQMMRANRCHPLYSGNDKRGNPMANWALDALIELMQRYYHKMNFTNTIEGWKLHSGNISLIATSIQFSTNEYTKVQSTDQMSTKFVDFVDYDETRDVDNRRKATKVPLRELEKQLIAEIILKSGVTRETPGRQYDPAMVWDVLKDVTTELGRESEVERGARYMQEARTAEEAILADITDTYYEQDKPEGTGTNGGELDGGEEMDDCDENEEDWMTREAEALAREAEQPESQSIEELDTSTLPQMLMDPALIGALYSDEGPEVEDEATDDIETEHEVVVGNRRLGKVKRAKINVLCFTNIWEEGKTLMKKKNLKECRLRAKEREMRQRKALKDILYNDVGTPEGEDSVLKEAWERLDNIV